MPPRATRSKKVEITEDETAQSQPEPTSPPPYSGLQLQTLAGNTMAMEENLVELELKGLKAAYREVIGVPKKRKGRSNKNPKENARPEFQDSGSPPIQPPVTRTTRGRAKAQEGPYQDEPDHYPLNTFKDSEQKSTLDFGRPRDADFLMSLIAGRSTGPSRSPNASISGSKLGHIANDYSFLAEEALRKASNQNIRNDADIQVAEVTSEADTRKTQNGTQVEVAEVAFEAEPKELKENFKDQHSIPVSSKSADDSIDGGVQSVPDVSNQVADQDGDQDSFVEQITSRSPAKPQRRDSFEMRPHRASKSPSKTAAVPNPTSPYVSSISKDQDIEAQNESHDSFVEHISSRSPTKPRIEDSVEALDQMEEVEEALHEAAMAERMVLPEKKRQKKEQPAKSGSKSLRVKPAPKRASVVKKATSMIFKPSEPNDPNHRIVHKDSDSSIRKDPVKSAKGAPRPIAQIAPKDSIMSAKPSTARPISQPAAKNAVKTVRPASRPLSQLAPKDVAKTTKPVARPPNFELPGEAIARKLKEQRERRKAQRQSSEDSFHSARAYSGPSVKSTKPLTVAAFELPGEALSRKKREAHEAKVKAQEEEERKRREFKAKPNLSSVRGGTVASRARQSRGEIPIFENTPSDSANLTVSKRSSMTVGAPRPSILELANMVANTSAPRAPGPINPAPLERKLSSKFHGPSMSGLAMQRTVSATEVQVQRQRAKEIYNRDQKLAEDIEREKREREAAAKRSREEAAERGRQASREWAEKQKAKKLAEGDKGMSTGYGPGGQMGLKA